MKMYMLLLCGILTFTACSKEKSSDSTMSCSKPQKSYHTLNGTKLNLDVQNWYLEKNDIGGGSIKLDLSGSIVGNYATIRTYGDGLIFDSPLEIDSRNEFDQDVPISFTATFLPEGDIISNTMIRVYSATDTLEVELESCLLRYE